MNVLRSLVVALLALAAAIGLLALCVRVAGGPHAWQVGLLLVVAGLPLAGFAARERR